MINSKGIRISLIHFVYGGSSSGKSEYAEELAMSLSGEGSRYYIATMDSHGSEAQRRISRHLAQREGKGFVTVECPCHISDAARSIPDMEDSTILIESVPTLLANEMFGNSRENSCGADDESGLACRIAQDLINLCSMVKNAVLVSDNIFEDGMEYSELSRKYVQYLGRIHQLLTERSQIVTEVNAQIPAVLKKDMTDIVEKQKSENIENAECKPLYRGLKLIIGGFAQGKLSWVLDQISDRGMPPLIFDERSFANMSRDLTENDPSEYLIINHLHLIVKQLGSAGAGTEWLRKIMSLCEEKEMTLIIISDEVGSGVVPSETGSIRYREHVGDVLRFAARAADRVYKVTCGIPVQLK